MALPLIYINNSKCTVCYACVRVCPVKAIVVKSNQEYPSVLHNRCIGCGNCFISCPTDAIYYYNSKEEVKTLLKGNTKISALISPSISSEFRDITDYRKFASMIKSLGFTYVNDVSFGVDIVARSYKNLFSDFKGKYYLTSNCPPVVSMIEKFNPELIDNLAPILSPKIAAAKLIHQQYGNDTKIVFIGPCIAAKQEILRYNSAAKIDAALTFLELRELFDEFNVKESQLEYTDFDMPHGNKGLLYPISNGLLQCAELDENLLSGDIVTAEGKNETLEAVKEFESNLEAIEEHFNIFYCEGCMMGPGTSKNGKKFIRKRQVIDYTNKRLKNFDISRWEEQINIYSDIPLDCEFLADDQRLPFPNEEKIEEILHIMGKNQTTEHGCSSCGYESCRHFAVAVAQGLAKTDMCINYSLKSKHEYIKTLKITNEKLAKTQEALKFSETVARKEQLATQEAFEQTSAMLQKLPSAVVLVDEKLKIIESNQSFINILGGEAREINEVIPGLKGADLKTLLSFQFYKLFSYVIENGEDIINRDIHHSEKLLNVSIFTLKKNKIVGAIIRDLYTPEVRREEVINRVNEAIEQNLAMVQQIAFLLGEGASKTEKMLNSVIESHKESAKE